MELFAVRVILIDDDDNAGAGGAGGVGAAVDTKEEGKWTLFNTSWGSVEVAWNGWTGNGGCCICCCGADEGGGGGGGEGVGTNIMGNGGGGSRPLAN